jgi:hypothetical protein
MDNTTNNTQVQRDDKLWKLAKRRAEFKKHLLVYLVINIFLWGIWLISGAKTGGGYVPWPAFVSFGWGIGLAFNFIGAYTGYKDTMVENEYNKLVNKG